MHSESHPEEPRRRKVRTATPSTVREVNRSILLHVIRTRQPVSRADISEKTGIFRSNVSEIVDELIAEGLVNEQRAVPVGRGRVPIHLSLNDDGFHVLGVSVRAHEVWMASAGLSGRIREEYCFPTPENPEALVEELSRAIVKVCPDGESAAGHGLRECGISVPGFVQADRGSILWIPSLPKYSGFPLADEVSRKLGVPVAVDNDCNLAALAEMWFSDGEVGGLRNFVFLEIGAIGVGAGIVLNRTLYQGYDYTFAAEFGHMVVDPAGPHCECGRNGCWELLVCDRATWRRWAPDVPFDRTSMDHLLTAAAAGVPGAVQALETTAEYLSLGISNIVFALNPEVVVLAGKIATAWDIIRNKIEATYCSAKIQINVRPARLPINEMFLHGSIHRALAKIFAKPKLGF